MISLTAFGMTSERGPLSTYVKVHKGGSCRRKVSGWQAGGTGIRILYTRGATCMVRFAELALVTR